MSDCLTDARVDALVANKLADAERRAAECHLAICSTCRRRVDSWASDVALAGKIKDARAYIDDDKTGTLAPGTVTPLPRDLEDAIDGYTILGEIHRGGQGAVYKAVQDSTGQDVAIKVLLDGPHASDVARKRFDREIELAAKLHHPNIVAVHDARFADDGRRFCVMDYVDGLPLHRHVRKLDLELEKTLELFTKVCDAVLYAHQKQIIHRDLKPANILIDDRSEPRILDFGLAKSVAPDPQAPVTLGQHPFGTPHYMSPEQANGDHEEIDTRTDIYALGVILYELVTGGYPYPVAKNIEQAIRNIADPATFPTPPRKQWSSKAGITKRSGWHFRPGACPIDDRLQRIMLKALEKKPKDRYQSVSDFAADVRRYLAGEDLSIGNYGALYELRKWMRRNRYAAVVFGLVSVIFVAFAGICTIFYFDLEEHFEWVNRIAAKAATRDAQLEDVEDEARKVLERLKSSHSSIGSAIPADKEHAD